MNIIFNSLPVDGPLRITSPFGPRNTGIAGASSYHRGVDLGRDFSKAQTAILAVASGVVSNSYWNDTRGWVVIIDHGRYKTLSQHLQSKGLPAGTKVKAGQKIGIMGASTKTIKNMATHLHFELIANGVQIDAGPYLRNIKEEVFDMTREELEKIIDARVAAKLEGKGTAVPDWAAGSWAEGKRRGIVDGSRPGGTATRAEVNQMIQNAEKGTK